MRILLDHLIDEIDILMDELNHNIHFHDAKSTGYIREGEEEDFLKAKKIEQFLAYIQKYRSSLFKLRLQRNLFNYYPTQLSTILNPYDFLYYHYLDSNFYLKNYMYYSMKLQYFMGFLFSLNKNMDYSPLPEVICNGSHTEGAKVPILDTDFSNQHKRRLNLFVENLRIHLNDEGLEKKYKALIKRTNSKFNDYAEYIDELFEQYEDLTFVCLELGIDQALSSRDSENRLFEFNANNHDGTSNFDTGASSFILFKRNFAELKARFLNNARNVDPLSRSIGYIGKWEWSTIKNGLYFRIILIFPTTQIGNMTALQNGLNFYWCESIADGQGVCHHAPIAAEPVKFKKSYCHINADNFKEREIFKKRVIGYLTKSEKYYCPPELRVSLNAMSRDKSSTRELSLTFRSKSKK